MASPLLPWVNNLPWKAVTGRKCRKSAQDGRPELEVCTTGAKKNRPPKPPSSTLNWVRQMPPVIADAPPGTVWCLQELAHDREMLSIMYKHMVRHRYLISVDLRWRQADDNIGQRTLAVKPPVTVSQLTAAISDVLLAVGAGPVVGVYKSRQKLQDDQWLPNQCMVLVASPSC